MLDYKKQDFALSVASNINTVEGTEAVIDLTTVRAVYDIVEQVIEMINECQKDATDADLVQMIRNPNTLQERIVWNILSKYLGPYLIDFARQILESLLEQVNSLSDEEILTMVGRN